ncbi:MAG: helix-turn-helix transcriptional regulator [Planctomycetes bacterium]|nr:helix-turn-helix transcriptional regulator [Planctomycetota bacterium]
MHDKIAERLRELRGRKGLSKKDVAEICNRDPTTVRNWEDGVNPPPADAIAILAKHYGVSADYLVGISDFPAGIGPDQWIVDVEAYEAREPGVSWAAKIPRQMRIVDYEELRKLEDNR